MPTYKITDPESGRSFNLTGDSPPTEQEISDIFSSQKATPSLGSVAKDAANAVGSAAPVVGGILGGAAGAVAGLGIGSIPAGAVGTAAGTGAGLAIREGIQNLTGTQDQTIAEQQVQSLKEPAIAGATDLAFGAGMKAIGAVGKQISKLIPKFAPPDVFRSIFKIPTKIQERMNVDLMAREMPLHGVSGSLDEMADFAKKVTGSSGEMSVITRELLGKTKTPVIMSEALTAADNAAIDATQVDPAILKRELNKITRIVSPSKTLPQTAASHAKAIDAWDAVKNLEAQGYDYINSSTNMTPRPDMEQLGQVYLNAADALKSQIDNAALKEGAIESLKTDAVFAKLRKISPRLARQFSEATSLADIRAIAKPFVDLNTAVRITKMQNISPIPSSLMGIGKALFGSPEIKSASASLAAQYGPQAASMVQPTLRAGVQAGQQMSRMEEPSLDAFSSEGAPLYK